MKKLIGTAALISGILLLVAPRYILPACEYEGFPAMHCSDTARAEMIVGALLAALGVMAFFLHSPKLLMTSSSFALALSVTAYMLPDKFGYCHSTRMPCNYGMVPGIRFIAVANGIIMLLALITIARATFKRGPA
jgi:hypothetical protein